NDRGESWLRIGQDLPAESVNVVYEDAENERLLFVGTDHGLYFSLDRGATFQAMSNGLPAVAVHDVAVQDPTEDLVVATHGRSLYRTNIGLLRKAAVDNPELTLVAPEKLRYSSRYGGQSFNFSTFEPETEFKVYHPGAAAGAKLTIESKEGLTLFDQDLQLKPGINVIPYDLSFDAEQAKSLEKELNKDRKEDEKPVEVLAADNDKFYLRAGEYQVSLAVGSVTVKTGFAVK
ncbi:MAG: glycosyl hydrolase, partial [Bacteroidota bacterium]